MNKTWTPNEIHFIQTNLTKTDKELWEGLKGMGASHSFSSVRKFRQRLNLKKKAGRPHKKATPNLDIALDKVILPETFSQIKE